MKKKKYLIYCLMTCFLLIAACGRSNEKLKTAQKIAAFELYQFPLKLRLDQYSYDQYYNVIHTFYEDANLAYLEGNRDKSLKQVTKAIDLLKQLLKNEQMEKWQLLNVQDLFHNSVCLYEKIIKNIYDVKFDNSQLVVSSMLEQVIKDSLRLAELKKWETYAKLGIPYTPDERVDDLIHVFSVSHRRAFQKWLYRSGYYAHWISDSLFESGLPDELVYLSMIESGFSPFAYSPASAVGLWQFVASTARGYGLDIDFWYDERKNPYAATQAAISHLKVLHNRFDNWYLAMAAYNAGSNRIRRVLRKEKVDDFWDLKGLPRETKRYVPKILAAMHICRNLDDYGMDTLKIAEPLDFDTYPVSKFMKLSTIANSIGVPLKELKLLNPELVRDYTHPDIKNYPLRLPRDKIAAFAKAYPKLKAEKKKFFHKHKLRRGESIWGLSRKYKVSYKTLLKLNKIFNPRRLRPGKVILVPIEAM